MKIVFLDIDGVLNNVASAAEGVDIIPEKVILVRRLCEITGAEIVISSSWRIMYDLAHIRDVLYHTGLKQVQVIDETPRLNSIGSTRGHEIQKWLDEHPEVTEYVIFDDDSDMLPDQKLNFIKTENFVGLTYKEFDEALSILGAKITLPGAKRKG